MTQSRPKVFRLTMMRLWVFLTFGLLLILIIEWPTGWLEMNSLAIYLTIVAFLAGLLGILIELPEVESLTIADDKITVRNLLTRRSKNFLFETIDEFKISIHLESYSGLKLDLILLKRGNAHPPISLSYIENLAEIVNELEKRLPNSTEDEYGLLEPIKKQ